MINTLLLLAISNKNNLRQIYDHPHAITDIIHQFTRDSFGEKLESVTVGTSFMYLLIVDV